MGLISTLLKMYDIGGNVGVNTQNVPSGCGEVESG
jgi:hypothetical protein